MKTGICLPGGGAAGCAQAGMLLELDAHREHIHAVSCASVGSLNGAMFVQAHRLDALDRGDSMKRLESLWNGIHRRDVYSRWPQILKLGSASFFSTTPLRRLIESEVNVDALAASPIKLFIHAAEYRTGVPHVATPSNVSDRLRFHDWLLAGAAIPVAFPPVRIDAKDAQGFTTPHWWVDGGCTDNTPFDALIDEGCDRIIVCHCHSAKPGGYHERKAPSRLKQALGIIGQLMQGAQSRERRDIMRVNALVDAGAAPGKRHIDIVDIYPRAGHEVGTLEFDDEATGRALDSARIEARRVLERLNWE